MNIDDDLEPLIHALRDVRAQMLAAGVEREAADFGVASLARDELRKHSEAIIGAVLRGAGIEPEVMH